MNQNQDPVQEREWNLQDYINLFFRHKMIILGALALVFITSVILSFARPAKYKSGSTFIIESSNMGIGSLLSPTNSRMIQDAGRPIEFYQALLTSQSYHEMFLDQAKTDSFIRASGIHSDDIYAILNKDLKLNNSDKTELVRLNITAGTPMLAYHLARIAINVFKVRCQQIELEETRNVVDYVEKQKDISRDKLENAERSLQEFKEGSSFAVSDEDGGLLKKLVELESALAEVQAQRELSEANIAAYNQRLEDLKAPTMPGMNEIDTPQSQSLRAQLDKLIEQRSSLTTDGSGGTSTIALDQQIDQVRNQLYKTIVESSSNTNTGVMLNQSLLGEILQNRIKEELQLYMLRNRERFFQRQVATYRAENPKLIERAIDMARLQRSKKVYEEMFSILLEKGEEARIKSATGTGGIRIIDNPTVPTRPVPVNIPRNLAMGLILGLGIGFGLALLREYMDNSIRNPEDITRQTGLPIMGSVPEMGNRSNSIKRPWFHFSRNNRPTIAGGNVSVRSYQNHLISTIKPRDPVVDSYRTLRTNLQFASVDNPISALLITSALPGEGKTLSSANIAITFAQLGKKVLLIDGDLRKPKQHEVFKLKSSPGLSNYLAKGMELRQVIYATGVPNLALIPCGTIPPNPAEMIASQRMTDFIEECKLLYDMVIIDAPPVRMVTDPLLFASKVTHLLIVVKANTTLMHDLVESTVVLARAQTPILGVLFNYVKTSRGYGDYYRYDYYYHNEAPNKY